MLYLCTFAAGQRSEFSFGTTNITPVKDNTTTPTSVCVHENIKGTTIALRLQRQLKLPCKNKTELEQLEYKIDIKVSFIAQKHAAI